MAAPTGSTPSTTTSAFVVLKQKLDQARVLKESVLNIQGITNSPQQLETNADWLRAQELLTQTQRALDGEGNLSADEYSQIFDELSVVAALGRAADS
ncbi:MAG: hypothetical protein ACRC9R_10150, partial [Enterovibrio sp.]